MDNKHTHLNMIQGIINRLSHNSFLLKGWSVVLISAMFALATNDSQILFVYLAYFPAVTFWFLDAYFLKQERLYRQLYDHVRMMKEESIDFSMNATIYENDIAAFSTILFSKTLFAFHGTVVLSIVLVTIIAICKF